jgi:hypothetical protein
MAYAPATGRLAAAMATISARRRAIRDRVERNIECNGIERSGRISIIPEHSGVPAETFVSENHTPH